MLRGFEVAKMARNYATEALGLAFTAGARFWNSMWKVPAVAHAASAALRLRLRRVPRLEKGAKYVKLVVKFANLKKVDTPEG